MRVLVPDRPEFAALADQLPGVTLLPTDRGRVPGGPADGLVLWFLPAAERAQALSRPGLRWVLTLTAGIDHVLPQLPPGAALYNASRLHDHAVAQHAAALLLAVARGLPGYRDAQRARTWAGARPGLHTLHGREVVIWGYGHIGRLMAGLLAPFGARVTGLTSRTPPTELNAALRRADDLVLLLPATPATRHTLNADRLATLKPGSWVYNLGRGSLIDEAALATALQTGLGGAALDVTDPEPLPPGSPLWGLDNVMITPHIASTTDDLIFRGAALTADFLRDLLAGREPPGRVEAGRTY